MYVINKNVYNKFNLLYLLKYFVYYYNLDYIINYHEIHLINFLIHY